MLCQLIMGNRMTVSNGVAVAKDTSQILVLGLEGSFLPCHLLWGERRKRGPDMYRLCVHHSLDGPDEDTGTRVLLR